MKKILVLGLGLLLNIGFCFAGTLHIRVASTEGLRGGCWEFEDRRITCTFSKTIGDNIAVFVKPDGRTIMLGLGQEWWYEE